MTDADTSSNRKNLTVKLSRAPRVAIIGLVILWAVGPAALAQSTLPATNGDSPISSSLSAQRESLYHAAIRLPIATALSTLLAYRPRRRGTPKRQLAVVQTQVILAIVGAIVMLVVGASLARAFGIVGAAGLIRYRAKIDDAKDAGVMLSTLSIGLASGVGLYFLAVFATVFVVGTLWVLESMEPEPRSVFELTLKGKEASVIQKRVEQILRSHRVRFELRSTSAEDISYEVRVPISRDTAPLSTALANIDPKQPLEVKWEKKKDK